jgi:hypothetical protein
MKGIRE